MKYFLFVCTILISALAQAEQIKVSSDFVGGNAIVEKIDGDDIWLHQDLRDTEGWWFYWSFEVANAAGREITVHFTNQDPIDFNGPAYSLDGGKTWRWLGKESVSRDKKFAKAAFKHKIPDDAESVRYSFSFPYHFEDFMEFSKKFESRAGDFKIRPLAKTKGGRQNIFATFGNAAGNFKIALTARHHACEATANFVMEGFIDEVMSDSETGKWLRQNVSFFVVPMVDLDGVQNGDQGKNRRPHDHNRDYEEAIYPSVAAIKNELKKFDSATAAPSVLIDLHAPWIGNRSDFYHRQLYFVYNHDPLSTKNLDRLGAIFERQTAEVCGGIKYFVKDGAPFGISWNNFKEPRSFKNWALTLPHAELSTTLEIPYSDIRNTPITDADLRNLGRTLAKTCMEYFKTKSTQK